MKQEMPSQGHTPRKRLATWKKAKTTCLIVLVICNLLLLAVFAASGIQSYRTQSRTRAQMDAMLSEKGIICGRSVYQSLRTQPQAYSLRMDSAEQERFSGAFLTGEVAARPDKSNTTIWSGSNGSISWSASGDISGEVDLTDQPEPTDSDEVRNLVLKLFRAANISLKKDQITINQPSAGDFEAKIKQKFGGMEVLGVELSVTIQTGNHIKLSGKWYTGTPETLYLRGLDAYSPEKIIFQLVQANTGLAQIISVQPVCVLSDKSGGRFMVLPCWRVTADNGDFVLNILTGDVVASSEIGEPASAYEYDSNNSGSGFGMWEDSDDDITTPSRPSGSSTSGIGSPTETPEDPNAVGGDTGDSVNTGDRDIQWNENDDTDDNQGETDEDSDWTTGILGPGTAGNAGGTNSTTGASGNGNVG